MPRLFLALPLTPRVKKRLAEEADKLRLAGAKVTWVNPENYHVTVRFLGEVPDEDHLVLDPLFREVASGIPPLKIVAMGLGRFPEKGTPRVVWCGTVGEEEEHQEALLELRRRLDGGLQSAGFRREKGLYHPHVTLGRVRSPLNTASLLERMGPGVRREFGHLAVNELVLYESARGSEGVIYSVVQTFPLGG